MHMLHSQIHQSDAASTNSPIISPYSSSSDSSSSGNRISPAILFIIIILAVIFFILGLLHLLVRFFTRHRSSASSSSFSQSNRYQQQEQHASESSYSYHQRQLQQLFHLHDSGLDQTLIDSLPVFLYKDIIGLKEPFDCAVCLCEFLEQDKLRLLPNCNHAFHIECIDTWLLSNSSCPLCRGTLYCSQQGFGFSSLETPFFGVFEEEDVVSITDSGSVNKPAENHIMCGKRVFSVRLGKFTSTNNNGKGLVEAQKRGEGESSSSGSSSSRSTSSSSNGNLDGRRCYSMGSYQYVVADSDLRVALCPNRGTSMRQQHLKGRIAAAAAATTTNGNSSSSSYNNIARKGESFSVSKIWQWSRKDDGTLTNNKFVRREAIP